MAIHIRRREVIIGLGGTAAVWPIGSAAQQPIKKTRSLGLLLPGLPEASMSKATRDRLRELGYTEGRDILLQARWADGKMERLDELAVELARLQVDVIIAYTTPGAIAARKATTTIPIVFLFVGDPVGAGVVPSLAHPGGNATGLSLLATELSAKRLEILLELAPKASRVAMLWNDANTGMVLRSRETQDAATKLGVAIKSVGVHDLNSFDSGFAMIDSFHERLVMGTATYAMEFFQSAPPLDRIYVPIGLGSSICGVSAARQALKTFGQNVAANMFDNDVNAALAGNLSDFRRPLRIGGIEDKFGAQRLHESTLGFG